MPLLSRTRFLVAPVSCCWLLVLTGPFLSQQVHAQATFSADSVVLFQAGGIDSDTASGPSPVTVSSSVANSNGTAQSESVAERGFLSLEGFVSAGGSKGTSGTFGGMFIQFRDVVIHSTNGAPTNQDVAATFQYFTSLNAAWSGALSISNRADMLVTAQIAQAGVGTFSTSDQYSKTHSGGSTGATGLETLAATIRTDTPFTVTLSFGANGLSAGTGSFGQYDMSANVGPVLGSFAMGGGAGGGGGGAGNSVFLLPAGFTADSPEMGLFDNQWQGIVPEPGNLALFWFGLFAIRLRRQLK